MKRCPKCDRTYDESLTFCLVDGTVLSAPFDPTGTPVRKTDETPPTQILNHQPSVASTTKGRKPWFFYAAIAFGIAVLSIGGIAWLVLVTTDSSTRANSELSDETTSTTPAPPQESSTPAPIDISGSWRDGFGNTSQIVQSGVYFRFAGQGIACGGRYESTGTGSVSGNRVELMYDSNYSHGQCAGTISPDGARLNMSCDDSKCGQFVSISERTGP